jgi:hypothetical protein
MPVSVRDTYYRAGNYPLTVGIPKNYNRGRWETRYSVPFGTPHGVWTYSVPGIIPATLLDCVVYVYPSIKDADKGERAGGSGFLVSVKLPDVEARCEYVVTAKYVIDKEPNPAVRVNQYEGKFESRPTNGWTKSPDADLAVSAINLSYLSRGSLSISSEDFVDSVKHPHLGVGDEVFMAGRFTDLEGNQKNTPTARIRKHRDASR